MTKLISSFNDIKITKNNTLVLCDIDDTILHYPECINRYLEIMKDFKDHLTKEELIQEFYYFCNMYKKINKPTHTDYEGFMNMIHKINECNGKLLFLTARNKSFHDGTKKHLSDIGVSCDDNDIHYTNNTISKGEYIKNNINVNEWNEIIFIDDYLSFIKSVNNLFPQIICYNFIVKKNIYEK
jgi:hypothetical protein